MVDVAKHPAVSSRVAAIKQLYEAEVAEYHDVVIDLRADWREARGMAEALLGADVVGVTGVSVEDMVKEWITTFHTPDVHKTTEPNFYLTRELADTRATLRRVIRKHRAKELQQESRIVRHMSETTTLVHLLDGDKLAAYHELLNLRSLQEQAHEPEMPEEADIRALPHHAGGSDQD